MRNIDLDINIFFNFDVSIISSISVCEAKSLYLSTLLLHIILLKSVARSDRDFKGLFLLTSGMLTYTIKTSLPSAYTSHAINMGDIRAFFVRTKDKMIILQSIYKLNNFIH